MCLVGLVTNNHLPLLSLSLSVPTCAVPLVDCFIIAHSLHQQRLCGRQGQQPCQPQAQRPGLLPLLQARGQGPGKGGDWRGKPAGRLAVAERLADHGAGAGRPGGRGQRGGGGVEPQPRSRSPHTVLLPPSQAGQLALQTQHLYHVSARSGLLHVSANSIHLFFTSFHRTVMLHTFFWLLARGCQVWISAWLTAQSHHTDF